MTRWIPSSIPLVLLIPITVACGDDKEFKPKAPFENTDDVRTWATSASAVAVYSHAYEPIGFADGGVSPEDPACPETTDDGTTFTVVGGCTDTTGREWKGRATVVRTGDDRLLTMTNFGPYGDTDGTVQLTLLGPSLHEFEADLHLGSVTTIDYLGTVEGDYGGRSVFNGGGRVEREGFLPPTGSVDATTVEEVVDNDVCAGQPVSGTTTLRSGSHTAVIVYDGATDCDQDQKAQLSVNDRDRGLIGGITCSLGRVGANRASGFPALALVTLGLVALSRRRRLA